MKQNEFAEYIGHGLAMLKQVEAGRKKMSMGFIEKAVLETGLPVKLFEGRYTADEIDFMIAQSTDEMIMNKPDGKTVAAAAVSLLPGFLAHAILVISGRGCLRAGLVPLEFEMTKTQQRLKIPRAEVDALRKKIEKALHGKDGQSYLPTEITSRVQSLRRAKKR